MRSLDVREARISTVTCATSNSHPDSGKNIYSTMEILLIPGNRKHPEIMLDVFEMFDHPRNNVGTCYLGN